MPRPNRRSSRSSNAIEEDMGSQESGVNEQPTTQSRGRKRRSSAHDEEEEGEEGGEEEEDSPEPRQKRRSVGEGARSNGGGASAGSGSGSRRLSGFDNITPSQEEQDDGPNFEFSQSADSARVMVANATAAKTKDLQTNEKDEKRASELSNNERATLIQAMMRFLVMKGLNREPATKKEMMDQVLGPRYRSKGVLKYVRAKAGELMRTSMGFKLKAVNPDKPFAVKEAYYVVNALNKSEHASMILKGQGQAARGLLTVILCLIYCNPDKSIAEDDLFRKLHEKIDARIPAQPEVTGGRGSQKPKRRVHVEGLGDVHDHLATFVKQHYLMKSAENRPTADGGEEDVTSYSMGARSYLEVGNQQVVTVMADIMGEKVDPSALLEMEDDMSQSQSQAIPLE